MRQRRKQGKWSKQLGADRDSARQAAEVASDFSPVLQWALPLFAVLLLLLFSPFGLGGLGSKNASAAPDATVQITVVDAQTGDPIPHFRWLINVDNSHDEDTEGIDGPSLEAPASYSPVLASGEEDGTDGTFTVTLPDPAAGDRGYVVSVLANDGADFGNDDYKLGGVPFTAADTSVTVELQPHPLPLSTMRVRVFNDNQLVNSEHDVVFEQGIPGFHVILDDRVGEVTTDWFGNPICTEYEGVPGESDPVPGTGGFCSTDADGWVVIPNLGPGKYAVQAIPPDGSDWIQTTTIEGKLEIDAWIEEGHAGFSTEEGLSTQALVTFGYVHPCAFGDTNDACPTNDSAGTATINGRVRTIALDDESGLLLLGNGVTRPYVALNNIGGNDEQVYTARGNADGTFSIPNVPVGLYQLVMWDRPLDHILSFQTVQVTADGQVVELGDIGIPRWFGTIKGKVFIDLNENGVRDDGEPPLPNQDLDTRYKDGTIQYAALSDANGNYEFPEVFELEHFAIAEVGYGDLKQTGVAAYATDEFGDPLDYPGACNFPTDDATPPDGPINCAEGLASLLQAEVTWAGTTNYLDWGKKPHDGFENGGIAGIVFYGATRNELDARLAANEDYEPGVPGVLVNLYAPVLDASGEPMHAADGSVMKNFLAATYGGADDWNANLPTDCIAKGSIGRAPGEIEPNGDPAGEPSLFPDCIELPALLNQVRDGVFDGGYAFENTCIPASYPDDPDNPLPGADEDEDGDGVPNRLDPDLLDPDCTGPLVNGKWIVEIVPPAGYRSVMEEDINVFTGDVLEPPPVPAVPPPPCAGPMHTVHVVDDYADANFDPTDPTNTQGVYNPDFLATISPVSPLGGSPYEGMEMPLCNARLVDLPVNASANSDFFVFTDGVDMDPATAEGADDVATGTGIQVPGRIRGVIIDDLTVEIDPASPIYGDKRGIPHTPVGVYDFSGNLITTVESDANGFWEVVLPSTASFNCPTPGGVCPSMYVVVGNDPGSPQSPNEHWNPNYGSLQLSFDVWPGLTTYADVAILPINASAFEALPVCEIPDGDADLQSVSEVAIAAASLPASITLNGSGLAGATLDGAALGTSGGGTTLDATIPAGTTPGPHQLLATGGGAVSKNGITIHVLGGAYTPTVHDVFPGDPGDPQIQPAIDDAAAGDLILVHPGVYRESVLVDKPVKLQGYGPGPGAGATVIDGRFFDGDAFAAKIAGTAYDGPADVPVGQVITVLAEDGEFTAGFNAQVDGFKIFGGTRIAEAQAALALQGGGIYAHAYARNLEVSNDLIQSNAGVFGGGITLGQAYVGDNENDAVRIHHDRILNNGGVMLAGGVGIFTGADGYEIDHNEICGNYSAEYGGGISHYGLSSGSIHDNELTFNYAFDEGGGIMVAGEQPANVALVSAGSGDVSVERNRIQGNVSNDDGGGIRLLQPVDGHVQMVNNMVVNNLATDAGGGISLDDALNAEIVNNTIARNISTSTAEDAPVGPPDQNPPIGRTTLPQGAGIVSEPHSQALLDATGLPAGSFSDPVIFNNIVWQNRACYLDGELQLFGTDGCEAPGLPSAGYIDLEVLGGGTYSQVTNNLCTATGPNCPGGSNIAGDPSFAAPGAVETSFSALAFGNDPNFVTVLLRFPPEDVNYPGNYHITGGSPAVNAGTGTAFSVAAPCDDFDGDGRPNGATWDIGADEIAGGTSACMYFSTGGNQMVPGVPDPDNADIYLWNGAAFSKVFDATDAGLSGGANVDGMVVVDANTFYLSFTGNVNDLNGDPAFDIQNHDIVKYDAGAWSLFFDGEDVGLTQNSENIGAFEILSGNAVVISTTGGGNPDVPGITGENDEDLLLCTGTFGPTTACMWSYYLDGSDVGIGVNPNASGEDIDGTAVDPGHIYVTTTGNFTVPGQTGGGEDVFTCDSPVTGPDSSCASFSLFFDGSAHGLGNNIDAIDVP